MTLRLEPAELGQVQIRIDRPQDAPAQVDISVQRPETLTLLLRDQPQLQRALDQAGVPADGRSLTLHMAPPDSAATPSGNSHASVAASADPGQGDGSGAGTRSGFTCAVKLATTCMAGESPTFAGNTPTGSLWKAR